MPITAPETVFPLSSVVVVASFRDHITYLTVEPDSMIWSAKINGSTVGIKLVDDPEFSDSIQSTITLGAFWGRSVELAFDIDDNDIGEVIYLRCAGIIQGVRIFSVAPLVVTTLSIIITLDGVFVNNNPTSFQKAWGIYSHFVVTSTMEDIDADASMWWDGASDYWSQYDEDTPPNSGGSASLAVTGTAFEGTASINIIVNEQVAGEIYTCRFFCFQGDNDPENTQQLSYSVAVKNNYTGEIISEVSDILPEQFGVSYPRLRIDREEITILRES